MVFLDRLKFGAAPVRGDLEGIQYIRAAAALMVAFSHADLMMAQPKYFGRHPFAHFFERGGVGVDLFFCLSGFIMIYVAVSDTFAPKLKPWDFFKRRFARIVPFMWLMIIMYAALRIVGRGIFPYWDYVRALTLFPVGTVEPGQIWTLRNEFLFYIIFAASFLTRRYWLFMLWVLSPFMVIAAFPGIVTGSDFWPQLAVFLFNNVNVLFGMGAVCGIAYVKTGRSWPVTPLAAPALAVSLAAVFIMARLITYDRAYMWEVLLIGLLCCICLLLACAVRPSKGLMGWFGKTIGDASFCIYLSHAAIIPACLGIIAKRLPQAPDILVVGTTMIITISAGVIVNKFVEDPMVSFTKAVLFKRPTATPFAVSTVTD